MADAAAAVLDFRSAAAAATAAAVQGAPSQALPAAGFGAARRRFRELSVLVHPDKCSAPEAERVRQCRSSSHCGAAGQRGIYQPAHASCLAPAMCRPPGPNEIRRTAARCAGMASLALHLAALHRPPGCVPGAAYGRGSRAQAFALLRKAHGLLLSHLAVKLGRSAAAAAAAGTAAGQPGGLGGGCALEVSSALIMDFLTRTHAAASQPAEQGV